MGRLKDALVLFQKEHHLLEGYQPSTARPSDSSSSNSSSSSSSSSSGSSSNMIMYGIYLLQLGFHAVAVVGKFVQRKERDSCTLKEKQYTKQYKCAEYTK